LLSKFGNSNTNEHIELVERFIRLFGSGALDCLISDREFVGDRWLNYLNDNSMRCYIRIRENFWVLQLYNRKYLKISLLCINLSLSNCRVNHRIVSLNRQLCYLSALKEKDKNENPDLQIFISFDKPKNALAIYKERWQIETAFRALKTSGFNIEDTHLIEIDRIEKLFA